MKKFICLFMVLALILTLAEPAQSVNAATIKLNYTKEKVVKGDYLYLKVLGTKSKIKWSVEDYSIATITKKGRAEGIKIGMTNIVAKVGKKTFKCKITVVPKPYPGYVTDSAREKALAERDYLDNFENEGSDDVEIVTEPTNDSSEDSGEDAESRIEKMLKYGFSNSEIMNKPIGKQYMKFCDTWVSEYELDNYDASVVMSESDNKLYIIFDIDNKIVLENVPAKLEPGTIYTISDITFQYLKDFTYGNDKFAVNQFYFDRQSLINKGLLK